MKHFLEISQMTLEETDKLIQRALHFKHQQDYPQYSEHTVANLFYENSTRTRVSFELAARHLKMPVVNLDLQSSSERKGEVIEDTVQTLAAMGVSVMVIRHAQEGLLQHLTTYPLNNLHLINAGDGKHAHPSQALLDMMTIIERKKNLKEVKIAIVGDIKHSRVANSMQCLCALYHVGELILIAPEVWQPEVVHYGQVTHSLQEGLNQADVVICLRVQQERLLASEHLDAEIYRKKYAITQESLHYAKMDAMIMHPGPINRGMEIDNDVADDPRSFILQQVQNGVYMRMAILEAVVNP